MEKDIGKIPKNTDTDIVIRIDDFGGRIGLTIREFVKGEGYTGFTKAGTRIPADKIEDFKKLINSIDSKDFAVPASSIASEAGAAKQSALSQPKSEKPAGKPGKKAKGDIEDMAM